MMCFSSHAVCVISVCLCSELFDKVSYKVYKKANAVSFQYCKNTASFIVSYRKELGSSFDVE